MALFSQRKGLKPIEKPLQLEGVDDDLKNSLWNCLHLCVWKRWDEYSFGYTLESKKVNILVELIWLGYYKKPLDEIPEFPRAVGYIKKHFFEAKWNEIFDFIEFVYAKWPFDDNKNSFQDFLKGVLLRENSGYRFLDGQFVEITSEQEFKEIQDAFQTVHSPVNSHIRRAVELLSDRKKPDYRNSIKESISAVEAICQILAKDDKATLGKALSVLENKVEIHPALKKGFSIFYGYTSDEDGIRHAMLEESNLSFNEAKYMLVSCSAFINYLIGKASDAGVEIKSP